MMRTEWIGSTNRDDLLEQLAQDLAEATTRSKHECEDIITHAIDNAYEQGYADGQEAQEDE